MARWPLLDGDFVGLARGKNRTGKVETSLSASERGRARPLGLISFFLPWLCLTRGGLEPFVGQPSNLGLLRLILNEATAVS